MIDWSSCPAVEQAPERYSGAWVFPSASRCRGTRSKRRTMVRRFPFAIIFGADEAERFGRFRAA